MSPPISQAVDARLTRAAIFMVVTLNGGAEAKAGVRSLCADLSALVRGVGFRALDGKLSCNMGIGSAAWDLLFGKPKPKELHPFREIRGVHHAPATPGDLLFHIRATRMDLCFELAKEIMTRLNGAVSAADQVQGFKYFDDRDLLGFVDGTENPVAQAAIDATLIGVEDSTFTGGSYVIVQKYLHDLAKWNAIPVEQQEKIVGRKKFSDIELDDTAKPSFAHNVLTTIEDKGQQLEILRDNMPFGDVAKDEFGTYFIGYARSPSRIERMLESMFVGNPPGNYDRLLDVSRAVDVPEPKGLDFAAAGTGHVEKIEGPGDGVQAVRRAANALIELRIPLTLKRQAIDDVERGATDSDWSPVKEAARKIAFAEDRAVFDGWAAAGIGGIRPGASNKAVPLPSAAMGYPAAVAQAVNQLRLAGCNGPYRLVLGADPFMAISGGSEEGYPVLQHIQRLVDGEIVWAPAIDGGLVLTTRGGDFELDLGQDLSIGYLSHTQTEVELYLQESFTFRLLTTEAVVAIQASNVQTRAA